MEEPEIVERDPHEPQQLTWETKPVKENSRTIKFPYGKLHALNLKQRWYVIRNVRWFWTGEYHDYAVKNTRRMRTLRGRAR